MTSGMRWAAGAAMLLLAGSGAAQAPASSDGTSLIEAVSNCRKIADQSSRLACFDQAAAALETARVNQGLVIMDKAQIREKRRSLFGFQLPKINLFGSKNDAPEEEIEELTSTIRSVSRAGRDNFTLRLADNSVWRTTEPSKIDPETGDAIVIRRAALGSYRAKVAGRLAVRIQRVE